MKHHSNFNNRILTISILSFCVFFFSPSSAQKQFSHSKAEYINKSKTRLVIGEMFIRSLNYQADIKKYTIQDPLNNLRSPEMEIDLNLSPLAISSASLVSLIGIDQLIKSNKIKPLLQIQKIPGLEQMGIIYPKLPALGIKYSL